MYLVCDASPLDQAHLINILTRINSLVVSPKPKHLKLIESTARNICLNVFLYRFLRASRTGLIKRFRKLVSS